MIFKINDSKSISEKNKENIFETYYISLGMNKNKNIPSIENQKNIESNKLIQISIKKEPKKIPILKMLRYICYI